MQIKDLAIMEVLRSRFITDSTKLRVTKLSVFGISALFLSLFITSSCSSDREQLSPSILETGSSLPIDDLIVYENTIVGVGGDTWEKGTRLRYSPDNGQLQVDSVTNKRIFSLEIVEDQLLAGGVDARIYTDLSLTASWTFEKLPAWGLIKDLVQTENGYIAAGGKSFKRGYFYHLDRDLNLLDIVEIEQEISAIEGNQSGEIIASAYGGIWKMDKDQIWYPLDVVGDFFTDLSLIGDKGITVGSNGSVLKTQDGGNTWTAIRTGNQLFISNTTWNRIEPIGSGWFIAGRNGNLAFVDLDLNLTKEWQLDTSIDIMSIAHFDGKLYFGGRNGTFGYVVLE